MTQQHPDGPRHDGRSSYDASSPSPVAPPAGFDAPPSGTAPLPPALRQPRWSGKKTAVVAALAIGLSSAGAITASATVPSGSTGGDGMGGRGGFGNFRQFSESGAGGFGGSQQGGSGSNMPSGAPGAGGQGGPGGSGSGPNT